VNTCLRLLTAAFLLSAAAFSQGLTSLTGIVTDPTGAVIPNATLTLESVTRGTQRTGKSDSSGVYSFPQVQPDRYKITAKASGFSDVVVNDVVLQINTPATVNITFEKIGGVTEVVSVSAEGTQVNTQDATLGNTIGTTPIIQLPAFARNVAGLLALQPGVTTFSNTDTARLFNSEGNTGRDIRDGAVNGGKPDQANVTLDGVDVNNQQERFAFTSVLRNTLDSVQEFRTTTTNANADQGRSSGAQVSLVTKSGTNDYHGSVYWYHRNTVTAANNFFNNVSGVQRPALLINIPGASVGGPIQRNKLFFFANWEQRSDRSATNVLRTVPTQTFRDGIIQYRDTAGNIRQFTPAEIRAMDPLGIGISSAAQQVFRSYPLPNDSAAGDGLNSAGYRFTAPIALRFNTYIARLDYTLGTRHTFFWRGNLQNDRSNAAPQYPGLPPNSVNLANAKGFALGHNAVITPNLISTFRYGLTRLSTERTGLQSTPVTFFQPFSNPAGFTTALARVIPTHHLSQDFTWNKGSHEIRFGGTMRFISNKSANYGNSFHFALTNSAYMFGTGAELAPPSVNPTDRTTIQQMMAAIMGLVTQGTSQWNYDVDGNLLAVGAPVTRNYKNEEYEMYVQDTWRLRRNLTLTLGLRYSLMPPVYEADGQQISPDQPFNDWLNKRATLADAGRPQSEAGVIRFLKGSDPNARPLYPYHKDLFAPRLALAYSPEGRSGLSKFFFGGPGRTSIRAGWGMFYDIIGQPLVRTYDGSAFGFSTSISNVTNVLTMRTAPRFTAITAVPTGPGGIIRDAPPGGFPVTYPTDAFEITNSIDDQLKMPYTMNMNFSIGREFGDGWYVQGSYVGRLSRRTLINRDLAMPTNLRDANSGQTYFEAATQIALLLRANTPTANVPTIPFWESFYGNIATPTLTATQRVYNLYRNFAPDYTSGLATLDNNGIPGCSRIGCNAMFNSQFSALSAWSSIGSGAYHGMQWTVRKRMGRSLTADFNYTWSKSIDLASVPENSGSFAGFVVNTWNSSQRRAVSDFDARHIFSSFWVWEAPFGRGKRWGSSMHPALDAIVGGWQLSGIWTQSTELPYSVGNGQNYPTNWQVPGFATPKGPTTPSTKQKNAPAIAGRPGPNLWPNPAQTITEWDFTLPGQTGNRNGIRGDGNFNIDMALAKRFVMPYSEQHSLQFRWETFNIGNWVRFNNPNLSLGAAGNWGKYQTTLNQPRQMQFALRYEF